MTDRTGSDSRERSDRLGRRGGGLRRLETAAPAASGLGGDATVARRRRSGVCSHAGAAGVARECSAACRAPTLVGGEAHVPSFAARAPGSFARKPGGSHGHTYGRGR